MTLFRQWAQESERNEGMSMIWNKLAINNIKYVVWDGTDGLNPNTIACEMIQKVNYAH